MNTIMLPATCISGNVFAAQHRRLPSTSSHTSFSLRRTISLLRFSDRDYNRLPVLHSVAADTTNSTAPGDGIYTVAEFMTRKEDLLVVETSTPVDKALETLVDKRITGFPVVDTDWNLVGVVSDYDLLALDSISGANQGDTVLFPDVNSSWKTFNEIQKLLGKTDGKVVGDLMTPAPLVVHETTNLGEAVRLLLETKYRRLPVVDVDGKLVGLITRGDVVRAALKIKHAIKNLHKINTEKL
ncbi:CBS domain-containing protein CBSX1, chloroplastic-like [Rutidosis leptorrhynchoides]|uniref:CBS domain-containing protein CBSX1, chloroplastic-like n=1 Tax=Rutidosis leptorrhynchoides TaxID=125765 RepID=UPI003A9A64CB